MDRTVPLPAALLGAAAAAVVGFCAARLSRPSAAEPEAVGKSVDDSVNSRNAGGGSAGAGRAARTGGGGGGGESASARTSATASSSGSGGSTAARSGSQRVEVTEMCELAATSVKALGYDDDETAAVVELLMYAQLRGNNQGIVQLISGGIPRNPARGDVKELRSTRSTAVLDGAQHIGLAVLARATDRAVAMAMDTSRSGGVAFVGTVNTSSTTGAIGYYARRGADAGMVTLVFAQSPELVAPHGTYKAFFGTNPLAVGFPCSVSSSNGDGGGGDDDHTPFVFDMATSAMAYFGLVTAHARGAPIPDDVAFDAEGRPTTDAGAALAGALKGFDRSYKGSGLALVIELLTGALVGGATVDKLEAHNWGNLVVCINPAAFRPGGTEELARRVGVVLSHLRSLPPVPGARASADGGGGVRIPGERGERLSALRAARGTLEVPTAIMDKLRALAGGKALDGDHGPARI